MLNLNTTDIESLRTSEFQHQNGGNVECFKELWHCLCRVTRVHKLHSQLEGRIFTVLPESKC